MRKKCLSVEKHFITFLNLFALTAKCCLHGLSSQIIKPAKKRSGGHGLINEIKTKTTPNPKVKTQTKG